MLESDGKEKQIIPNDAILNEEFEGKEKQIIPNDAIHNESSVYFQHPLFSCKRNKKGLFFTTLWSFALEKASRCRWRKMVAV